VWNGGRVISGGGSNVLDTEKSCESSGSVAVERIYVRSLLLTVSLDANVLIDGDVFVIDCRAVSIAKVADDVADVVLKICWDDDNVNDEVGFELGVFSVPLSLMDTVVAEDGKNLNDVPLVALKPMELFPCLFGINRETCKELAFVCTGNGGWPEKDKCAAPAPVLLSEVTRPESRK
jgi:hypothetical protein